MKGPIINYFREWYEARPVAQRIAELVALAIFCIAIIASALYANTVINRTAAEHATRLNQQASAILQMTNDSVRAYNHLLLGASALYAYGGDLTKEQWAAFYQDIDAAGQFPESLGVGYAKRIVDGDVVALEQYAAEVGSGEFRYRSDETWDDQPYTAILHLQPDTSANKRALGYDMFSEENRRIAMTRARDEATIVMTAPVTLVQDDGTPAKMSGVLIYYPTYEGGVIPKTVDERRQALTGFVYVVTKPGVLIETYLEGSNVVESSATVHVYDNENPGTANLFNRTIDRADDNYMEVAQSFTTDGRSWTVEVGDADHSPLVLRNPWVLFGLGTVLGAALALVIFVALLRRLSSVEQKYESEVQRSKDELLALASHQLRTPASGVKQYIGMLTAGIMGELTPSQQAIAEKAYDTNERQLHIINELLYVSKIDAGQLLIEPRKVDMTPMTQKALDDLIETASHKNITVYFRRKRPLYIIADARYVRMIIENLISNAIKYSYPSSTVTITLVSRGETVDINVQDAGVGLAPENIEKAFGKFNRINNPLSYDEGGSGLGLFLARQLARAHGGDITVESAADKGSTFTLSLPRELTINSTIVNINDALGDMEQQ